MSQHSATDLEAKVVLKIGPVKPRFGGKVALDTADAPPGFRCAAKGLAGWRALPRAGLP